MLLHYTERTEIDITALIDRADTGDAVAAEQLQQLLIDELQAIAAG